MAATRDHIENKKKPGAPTSTGPSFFERLGDTLHHLLPFLEAQSLCRLDTAMTNREARYAAWLSKLVGLDDSKGVLLEVEDEPREGSFSYFLLPQIRPLKAPAFLAALRWMVVRGVSMPECLWCPKGCDAGQLTACFERCRAVASIRCINLHACSGTITAAGMMNLQYCTGLTKLSPTRLLEKTEIWEQLDSLNWACFNTLKEYQDYHHQHFSVKTAEIWGRRFNALVSISIQYCNDGSLEHLCNIKTLQDISLECRKVNTPADLVDLTHLNKLPALRTLALYGCDFTDAALEHIKANRGFKELKFCNDCNGLSAAGIALIAERFNLLKTLYFYQCGSVTDADVAVLSRLTSLQELSLCSQESITDAGVAHLKGLTCLKHLSLEYCHRVTSQSLAVIGSLNQLLLLDVSTCGIFSSDESSVPMVHLSSLTNLTHLYVRDCCFTDAGLDSLHSAANLDTLVLGDGMFSDDEWLITGPAVERLVAACTKLKVLEFTNFYTAEDKGILTPAFQAVLKRRGIIARDYSYY